MSVPYLNSIHIGRHQGSGRVVHVVVSNLCSDSRCGSEDEMRNQSRPSACVECSSELAFGVGAVGCSCVVDVIEAEDLLFFSSFL